MDDLIDQAVALLQKSKHAVSLTGAGISTPSGIPDFRGTAAGLWGKIDPMEVASIYAFRRRPESFYDWVRPFAELILNAEPNPAHRAMTQLQKYGPLRCIITQNIDMLHTRAGSTDVYEVHGHLRQATCLQCLSIQDAEPVLAEFVASGEVPHCTLCGGILKPNVILYGELLPAGVINRAKAQIEVCDLMLIVGSSLEVVPASELPLLAKRVGAQLIIVNLEPTYLDDQADVVIRGDVVDVLPRLATAFVG